MVDRCAQSAREAAAFFDTMAPRYDADLIDLGWDPVALVKQWPFVAQPGARVLDVGCGTGALLERFAGCDRELAGFDVSPGMLRQARLRRTIRGAEMREGAAGDTWPYDDGAFDVVLALAMLEFVGPLDVALDELGRVLAPFGRALITVEDVVDMGGISRERHERRYGEFDLWRRDREQVEMSLPPGLEVVRYERHPGYTVLERGFTCAYHVLELVKPPG